MPETKPKYMAKIIIKAFYLLALFMGIEEFSARFGLFNLSDSNFLSVLASIFVVSIVGDLFLLYSGIQHLNVVKDFKFRIPKEIFMLALPIYIINFALILAALANFFNRFYAPITNRQFATLLIGGVTGYCLSIVLRMLRTMRRRVTSVRVTNNQ